MIVQTTPWIEYSARHDGDGHTVVGTVRVLPDFFSPQLDNQRDILVCLPASYAAGDRRYPVLYMHDGQNLFDRATGFAGQEWQVDETMQTLAQEGLEAIVVGIHHAGEQRLLEYNPFAAPPRCGGRYLEFLVDTVKPVIDRDFRTLPGRAHTGILGSSMGGLISLYAFFHRPDVFGLSGVMSPSLWVNRFAIFQFVREAPATPGRIYVDNGTREGTAEGLRDLLLGKGYHLDQGAPTLMYVRDDGGEHTEAAWARRLPGALRFLLPDL
jgi:predicted alpha/beta superfamily hydrolase